jgi:hypothetical protein
MADLRDLDDQSAADSLLGFVAAAGISGTLCILLRWVPVGPPSSPVMTAALLLLAGSLGLASTQLNVSLRAVDVLALGVACVLFAGDLLATRVGLSSAILGLAIGALGRQSPSLRVLTAGVAIIIGLVAVLTAIADIRVPVSSLDLAHPNEAVAVLALALAAALSDPTERA